MIDWQNVSLDDFSLEVDSGEVHDLGNSVAFPIKVICKDGSVAFTKSVCIRAQFYSDLRLLPDWERALWKIFRTRIREAIADRRNKSPVSIEDKLTLMSKHNS